MYMHLAILKWWFFRFCLLAGLKKLPSMGNYNLKRDNLVNLKLINTNYL